LRAKAAFHHRRPACLQPCLHYRSPQQRIFLPRPHTFIMGVACGYWACCMRRMPAPAPSANLLLLMLLAISFYLMTFLLLIISHKHAIEPEIFKPIYRSICFSLRHGKFGILHAPTTFTPPPPLPPSTAPLSHSVHCPPPPPLPTSTCLVLSSASSPLLLHRLYSRPLSALLFSPVFLPLRRPSPSPVLADSLPTPASFYYLAYAFNAATAA